MTRWHDKSIILSPRRSYHSWLVWIANKLHRNDPIARINFRTANIQQQNRIILDLRAKIKRLEKGWPSTSVQCASRNQLTTSKTTITIKSDFRPDPPTTAKKNKYPTVPHLQRRKGALQNLISRVFGDSSNQVHFEGRKEYQSTLKHHWEVGEHSPFPCLFHTLTRQLP